MVAVSVPRTVIFTYGTTTLWIQVFAPSSLLLCVEIESGDIHLGSALSCRVYNLTSPSDMARFYSDVRAEVLLALRR